MRRALVMVAVLLLLGAIVNVAVVYGILMRVDETVTHTTELRSIDVLPWPEAIPERAGRLEVNWSPTFGSDRIVYVNVRYFDETIWGGAWFAQLSKVGWPVRSFEGGFYEDSRSEEIVEDGSKRLDREWQLNFWAVDHLPFRPLWPGFAINTLFYAGMLWVLFLAPFQLCRTMRIKRGRCPKCAYPAGESPVCTECGKRLPDRVRARAAALAGSGTPGDSRE